MINQAWIAPVTVLAAFLASCSNGAESVSREVLLEQAKIFIPEDASNVVIAPNIPWVQISFDVRRDPLAFAIGPHRLHLAKESGWTLCQPRSAEWTGYLDEAVAPPRYTQQKAYTLYKNGVLVTLTGTYHSDSMAASVRRSVVRAASNPIQHSMVIAKSSTNAGAAETAASLGLICE